MSIKLLFYIIIACILSSIANASTIILPTIPNIQYIGRLHHSNLQSPKFNWVGTKIISNFEGNSLKLLLKCSAVQCKNSLQREY